MSKSLLTKHCPYCQIDAEVSGMSAREIPGYKNPLTGKSMATVERLSCGHEFVDNKFNIDALYHFNPRPEPIQPIPPKIELTIIDRHECASIPRAKKSINLMDVLCAICLVFLAVTVPPLAILPILYFVFRTR